MGVQIEFGCGFCAKSHQMEIDLPEGWLLQYETATVDEHAFCPEHAPIAEFAQSQCPGCVGGWGDCPLWRGFAFKGQRDLTEADFSKVETGICPRRTNGTFTIGPSGISEHNISDRAPVASGEALVKAIREYWERYP